MQACLTRRIAVGRILSTQMLELNPEHVSIYLMEIDEGSRLGLEVLQGGDRYSAKALPSDDAMANYYEHGCRQLAAAGYLHYEISNWGCPDSNRATI